MTIKRYCRYKGIMCSLATEFGYCNLTACVRSQRNCFDETERDAYHALSEAIGALQEQKTGKWITKSDTNPYYTTWWYECSECGQKPLRDEYWQEVLSDYCPNCGTRMECEEE